MKEPYFESFEIVAQMPILAEHFYGKYLENVEQAEVYNTSTNLLFGSGPYRLANVEDWVPGQTLELVANERYWGVPRHLFKVDFSNDYDGYGTVDNLRMATLMSTWVLAPLSIEICLKIKRSSSAPIILNTSTLEGLFLH